MNAYSEVVFDLLRSVEPAMWAQQSYLSQLKIDLGIPTVEDLSVFQSSPLGAYGFAWIRFTTGIEYLILPFRLSRSAEVGELIRKGSWSLSEASGDGQFYAHWKQAMVNDSQLPTYRGGVLREVVCHNQPQVFAMSIWSHSRNASVRVETLEAYKIFRVHEHYAGAMTEVKILEYLTTQNSYRNYPKLISYYEYRDLQNKPLIFALSMNYIPNNGLLWKEYISKLMSIRAYLTQHGRLAKETWEYLINRCEMLGRTLAEFHSAMVRAKGDYLAPELCATSDDRLSWISKERVYFQTLTEKLQDLIWIEGINKVTVVGKKMFEAIEHIPHLGLKITIHGNLHLGQIINGYEDFCIVDYAEEAAKTNEKSFAIIDLASLIYSINTAWYSAFGRQFSEKIQAECMGREFCFNLHDLEQTVIRFYLSRLKEDLNALELLPLEEEDFGILFDYFYLRRALYEFIKASDGGTLKYEIALKILVDFISARTR